MTISRRVRRSAMVAAVALALASVGAACGDDDGESTGTSAAGGSVEMTTTDPDRASGSSDAPTTPDTPDTTEATGTTEPMATEPSTTEPKATEPVTTEPVTTQAPVTTTTPTTAAPVRTTPVNVYWGWTVLDPAGGSPERIAAGARDVEADTPVQNSVEALFDGVDPVEAEIGMTSSIPEGTELLGIAVDGTTATVDVSAEFERPGGTLDESMRLAQVVFTVTQFDGFDRVRFHVAGEPRDAILSHGVEIGDGLTRGDFPDVRARIMVEEPSPGAEVGNPLVIRGESNTFEGTVRYAISVGGGDGVLLTEGFTTASGGMGTWGTFEIEVDLTEFAEDYVPGPGSVILWEDDPRSGDRVDLVEIPVVLPDL